MTWIFLWALFALSTCAGAIAAPVNPPILSIQKNTQQNLLPPPELQELTSEQPKQDSETLSVTVDERPLWRLLQQKRYLSLRESLAKTQSQFPDWHPPVQLMEWLRVGMEQKLIEDAIKRDDRLQIVNLAKRYPQYFRCQRIDWLWALADAYARIGRSIDQETVYRQIIDQCSLQDQISTLQMMLNQTPDYLIRALLTQSNTHIGWNDKQRGQLESLKGELDKRQLLRAAENHDFLSVLHLAESLWPLLSKQQDAGLAALIAWQANAAKQPKLARLWFQRALKWQPSLLDARYGLALLDFQANNWREVIAQLQSVEQKQVRINQLLADSHFALAINAHQQKQYDIALTELYAAGRYGKKNTEIDLQRAWILYQQRKTRQAAVLFDQVYRQHPDLASAEGWLISHYDADYPMSFIDRTVQQVNGPIGLAGQDFMGQRLYQRKQFLASEWLSPGKFSGLQHIATPQLGAGVQVRDKSGVSGLSRLYVEAMPVMEGIWNTNNRQWRLRLSRLNLDSDNLLPNSLIGSAGVGKFKQTPVTAVTDLVEPTFGFRQQGWRSYYATVGTTPFGADLSAEIIGNLGVLQQQRKGYWQTELFARPVRESLLSYIGIVDPYTGQSWGRVRKAGVDLNGFHQMVNDWGVSGRLEGGYLFGKNVSDNLSWSLGLGLSKAEHLRGFDYFSWGPEWFYDGYAKNLSHFTLGQGGYFSPDYRIASGLSVNFLTEEGKDYMVKGRVHAGYAVQRESASDCFPALKNSTVLSTCTSYAAAHAADANFNAEFSAVARLSAHWQLGGAITVRRSTAYDDQAGQIFLRYQFDSRSKVMSGDLADNLLQNLFSTAILN